MDKELARKLLPLVNDPVVWGEISSYIESRILDNHKHLEYTRDDNLIREYQGALLELRKLEKLRDTVIVTLKGQ